MSAADRSQVGVALQRSVLSGGIHLNELHAKGPDGARSYDKHDGAHQSNNEAPQGFSRGALECQNS